MENYLVSARKYRPSTFSTVVGQKALTATLRNSIATNRLAHAYLFCGSRGVGKTSCARIFAKTINCTNPTADGNPCNECDSCRSFNENRSLNIVELDAASNNGVDDMRALIDQVQVLPTGGKYRVFIIDEVHMLSNAAFNAFLKTLEEPPSYVIFILATTEKHKVLPTILSRCQIYDFNRITINDMVDHLAYVASNEGITAERAALSVIASKADGAMRDALSIFDQVAASSRGNITYQSAIESLNVLDASYYRRLFEAFEKEDVPAALTIYKDVRDRGFDSLFFINGIGAYLRDLMLALTDSTAAMLEVDETTLKEMKEQARRLKPEFYYSAMSLCNEADLNYRQSSNKTFFVELLLIKLCQLLSPSQNSISGGEGQLRGIAASQGLPQGQKTNTVQQQPVARQVVQEPQAPAMQRPRTVVVPPPPPPAAPVAARTSGRRVNRGPSLSDLNRKPEEETVQNGPVNGVVQARRGVYSLDDVREAWYAFMDSRPGEHILVNTMRASMPEQVEGDVYKIVVENRVQTDMMQSMTQTIEAFMRDRLRNDFWSMRVEENQGAGSPQTWNEREILNKLMEDNESVRKLVTTFRLTL
ncbi:MAG: DNA polymerase III subunit gamma/tau [Muribaculaceae bacterium]|nr:DNA polymerase III subunit gamma/tau [Muribaculaceae bacterium]